jgi:hypothetical protein
MASVSCPHPELLTNQTLEGKGGVLRVHPSFSMQTNKTLTMLGECDDGGRCPYSFPFSLTPMFAVAHSLRSAASSPDLWAHYYTPNRCTAVSERHGSPMFDPTCICATAPANLAPSTEDLKHIYPSPPHTDSDTKYTVPPPILSEDSPSHAKGIAL